MTRNFLLFWGVPLTILFSALLAGDIGAGDMEPPGPPASTMKSLDEIPPAWSQILDSTDGDAEGCNSSRFECVMGGVAVLDKETGLVWERNPETTTDNWYMQWFYCHSKILGGRKGWRLPTLAELLSLVDPARSWPALPLGHPFTVPLAPFYWSATTSVGDPNDAMYVSMITGGNLGTGKNDTGLKWCVRGGQGVDGL